MTEDRTVDLVDRAQGLFLGAAVGDALGWPQEQRSGIVGGQKSRRIPPSLAFRAWRRWDGGPYTRYEGAVAAGEYSDDTQLLLATARASARGDAWLSWLTLVELPIWPLYQRGGGKAVLTACRSWQTGTPPWKAGENTARAYFRAGANGAAMRISPHALITIRDRNAQRLIERVVRDSLLTHGHPRALLGAVIYSLAVRHTLQQRGTLEYGDTLAALEDSSSEWASSDLAFNVLPEEWKTRHRELSQDPFQTSWTRTAQEIKDLISIAQRSLARAALADEEETLDSLGCFDPMQNGAGTITAVAACYLAARAAVSPSTGLLRSAFLVSADTDTLASMTAGLLGALHGSQWLSPLLPQLQDRNYLMMVADSLTSHRGSDVQFENDLSMRKVTAASLSSWMGRLPSALERNPFLDGRALSKVVSEEIANRSNLLVTRYRIVTQDGQSMTIDDIRRGRKGALTAEQSSEADARKDVFDDPSRQSSHHHLREITRVALQVCSVKRSRWFYSEVLGLAVHGDERVLYVTPWLVLRQKPEREASTNQSTAQITVTTTDPKSVIAMIEKHGIKALGKGPRDVENSLRVLDPDGNEVLIWPAPDAKARDSER